MSAPQEIAMTGDCRSEEGIIIGLVDGMIAQARVVALYLRGTNPGHEVRKALADINSDKDVAFVVSAATRVELGSTSRKADALERQVSNDEYATTQPSRRIADRETDPPPSPPTWEQILLIARGHWPT